MSLDTTLTMLDEMIRGGFRGEKSRGRHVTDSRSEYVTFATREHESRFVDNRPLAGLSWRQVARDHAAFLDAGIDPYRIVKTA